MRPRPDDAHLALQNIDQLRELVEARSTQKASDTGQPVVEVNLTFTKVTDADTQVEPFGDDLGYLVDALDRGADAVGGIPSTNLDHAHGPLPYIRFSA